MHTVLFQAENDSAATLDPNQTTFYLSSYFLLNFIIDHNILSCNDTTHNTDIYAYQ